MANEDARENSVMKDALKLATVGAAVYGAYRGGKGLIKNYDDLGSTVLGKTGSKMTSGIKKGVSNFDKADGSNMVRESLDKAQDKILERDYKKAFDKGTKAFSQANPSVENASELRDRAFNSTHEAFKSKSASGKRSQIDIEKSFSNNIKNQMKEEAMITKSL